MTTNATEPFEVKMHDGSIFTMPSEVWQRAFNLKYAGVDIATIKKIFADEVKKHWDNKTVLTKFGAESWMRRYSNQSDLGKDIMYQYIRASLLSVIFSDYARKTKTKPVKVIGIGAMKTTLYDGYSSRDITCSKKKKSRSVIDVIDLNDEEILEQVRADVLTGIVNGQFSDDIVLHTIKVVREKLVERI